MNRVLHRTRALLALGLLAALAACGSDPMRTPEVPYQPSAPPVRSVDPEIDAWFRATDLAASGTLQAGDVVRVELQGLPEYAITREIPPDGTLPLFRAPRSVDARSKTTQELESEIAEVYASQLQAYVTVTLVQAAPRQIYVDGAVRTPQAYPLRPGERLTLLQALILAGGVTDVADLGAVTIMRYHPALGRVVSSAPLDVESVQLRGEQRDNLAVLPGDTIVVPAAAHRRVHVLGHVERPGPLRWYDGITLSRAVTEAGGFKKFARTAAIRVVRGGNETIVFDFTELLAGHVDDLLLQPGDVVYVDEKWI